MSTGLCIALSFGSVFLAAVISLILGNMIETSSRKKK